MSVFRLAKNDEEIMLHMEQYIGRANKLGTFYKDFNFRCHASDWEAGWIEFVHTATEYDMNRYGNIHGGVIMMLVDTAAGLAAFETGTGNSSPTMDMSISFIKAIHVGDEMVMRAQVLNTGKHTTTMRTDIFVGGEMVATATSMHRAYTGTRPERPVLLND
ncbi:MAG: PaaI family thioesterase [Firmicutes bacterium]|nr:PaaI family thioesterase [Bacillota bacterium]